MALNIKSGYNISLPTSYNLGNYIKEPKLPISFSGVIATNSSKPMAIISPTNPNPYLSLTTNQSISKGDLVIVILAKDNDLQDGFSGVEDGIIYFISGSVQDTDGVPTNLFIQAIDDLEKQKTTNSYISFITVTQLTEPVIGTGFFISEKDYPINSILSVQSSRDQLESPVAGACSILLFKNYSNYYGNLIRPSVSIPYYSLGNNIISHELSWPGPGSITQGYNYTVSNISRTATSTFDRPNNKKLFLRILASEGPSTDTFSPTAGWTAIPVIGTTGGGGATNISVWAEFLISNNSSVTSNPTVPATSKMVQFFEIASDSDINYIY